VVYEKQQKCCLFAKSPIDKSEKPVIIGFVEVLAKHHRSVKKPKKKEMNA